IFRFKNNKQLKLIALLEAILLPSLVLFLLWLGTVWMPFDYQILDRFYAYAIQHGYGPPRSAQIVYVTYTDDSYKAFGTNMLDRAAMARVNDALAQFGAAAVAYDIIFARPSTPPADERFAASLQQLSRVYLPIGLETTASAQSLQWQESVAYEHLR